MKKVIISFSLYLLLSLFLFADEGIFYLYTPDRADGKTASGADFNSSGLTCAHSTLPFGTKLHIQYNGSTLSNVIVTDRIDGWGEDVFAVSSEVLKNLNALDESCINATYAILSRGDNSTSWPGNNTESRWRNLKGIESKNLFELFSSLVSAGYKAKFENDSLTLLYINLSRLKKAYDYLESFSVSRSSLEEVNLLQPPLRE